ncbi:hypothetical protein RSAG8_13320, partial [Rhizoctonia solani AG-8 WAC10335]
MPRHHEGQRHTMTASEMARATDLEATVKNLDESILKIQNYFDEISGQLRELALVLKPGPSWLEWLGLTSQTWNPITEWNSISKDYDRFVGESRKQATTTANRVKIFREEIIPLLIDRNRSLSNKKYRLEKFIEGMDQTENAAQELSDGFSMIPRRIKVFHQVWGKHFSHCAESINSKVKDLENRIDYLQAEMENDQNEPKVAGELVGDNIILAALEVLGEETVVLLFKSIYGVNVVITEGRTRVSGFFAERELADKNEECNSLRMKGTELKHLIRGYFMVHESRTEDVCKRLKGIANIWATVRTDAQLLCEHMSRGKNETDEQEFHELVQSRRVLEPIYKILEDILFIYARKVA